MCLQSTFRPISILSIVRCECALWGGLEFIACSPCTFVLWGDIRVLTGAWCVIAVSQRWDFSRIHQTLIYIVVYVQTGHCVILIHVSWEIVSIVSLSCSFSPAQWNQFRRAMVPPAKNGTLLRMAPPCQGWHHPQLRMALPSAKDSTPLLRMESPHLEQTNISENITFPQLRLRAVIRKALEKYIVSMISDRF